MEKWIVLKKFKIFVKINIKTAPTQFDVFLTVHHSIDFPQVANLIHTYEREGKVVEQHN